jgi:hypothetical protein
MLAFHEHFRLDDGNQPGILAQRGIASRGLRVGLDATPAGNAIANGNDRAPLGKAEVTPPPVALLPTAASSLILRLSTGGRGQELLPTVVAAKVERLSIAFGVESGCFVHGHAADGVFGLGFRLFHGHTPFLVVAHSLLIPFFTPTTPRASQQGPSPV